MNKEKKNIFYLVGGAIAAGKSTFMDSKLYNGTDKEINFFDHDKEKLMVQLYAPGEIFIKGLTIAKALTNAINDSIKNSKDFMLQVHFSTEQLPQINTYFHKYGSIFQMEAHFIGVDELSTLKLRAERRESTGGHSSESKSIEKTYEQSFKNFAQYIPKLNKATVWDNSEDYGFHKIKPQFLFVKGKLDYQNPNMTNYSKDLLKQTEQLNLRSRELKL